MPIFTPAYNLLILQVYLGVHQFSTRSLKHVVVVVVVVVVVLILVDFP